MRPCNCLLGLGVLALGGCTSINSTDLVVTQQLRSPQPLNAADRTLAPLQIDGLAGDNRLEQLLVAIDNLKSQADRRPSGTAFRSVDNNVVLDTGSSAAEELLREPAVRQVVAAMVEARKAAENGDSTARTSSISSTAVFNLGHALGSARQSMLDDLASGEIRHFSGLSRSEANTLIAANAAAPAKPTFAFVLTTYYKELANGKFIDRRGQQLAKLKYSDGVGNDTLGELVTVFFEALCDHALYEELPLFYKVGSPSVVLTTMYSPVIVTKDGNVDRFEIDNDLSHVVDIGTATDARPGRLAEAFTIRSVKPGSKELLLTDSKSPTAVATKIVQLIDLNNPAQNVHAITEKQLKAVRTVSNFAGQRAKGAGGLLFGFLGKIDISFVLGAGFSVGDNKTLQEIVTAVAEVASRRLTEWASYSYICKHNDSRRDPLFAAGVAPGDPAPFWEQLESLPD